MFNRVLVTGLLVLFVSTAFAQEGYKTKALSIGNENTPAVSVTPTGSAPNKQDTQASSKDEKKIKSNKKAKKGIGLSYSILLQKENGKTQRVKATRSFKSGERFKLAIRLKQPSYIYVLNEDPSGNAKQIYPMEGENIFFDKKGEILIPEKGYFEFDSEPGKEYLLIYASQEKLDFEINKVLHEMEPDVVESSEECVEENENAGEVRAKAIDYIAGRSCGSYRSKGIAVTEGGDHFNSKDPNLLMMLELKHK